MPKPIKLHHQNGKSYPVMQLAVDKSGKSGQFVNRCLFCGERHIHGKPGGHRVAHCGANAKEEVIYDGYILSRENGYMIEFIESKIPTT